MATRRRICRIRVLAKNSPVLANSSTRQNGHFRKLAGLDTFARHSPTIFPGLDTFANHFARTCQTCERKVWQLLHEFSEFGEFSECRLDRLMHIKYVICA